MRGFHLSFLITSLVLVCSINKSLAEFDIVWKLGIDDGSQHEFSQESFFSNAAPGSAAAKDDDYYFTGSYPAPVGTLTSDEILTQFERAITEGDPNNRIHFNLTASQASTTSRFRLRVDFLQAGWWTGSASGPGYGLRDITLRINGSAILSLSDVSADQMLDVFFTGQDFAPVAGENVVEISRTAGSGGDWVQVDYAQLEVDVDALDDGDSDNLPRYWEVMFGMDDSDGSDAFSDVDGDGRTATQEYAVGTSPVDSDSDNDLYNDGDEASAGTDPLNRDTDNDTLLDGNEVHTTLASDPLQTQSDSDGANDAWERYVGTDPSDSASVPWQFPGAVGLNVVTTRRPDAALNAFAIAGHFPQQNWNNTPILPDHAIANGGVEQSQRQYGRGHDH